MIPVVNTEVKMPKKMFNALTLLETHCVAHSIKNVDINFVFNFLRKLNVTKDFKKEYLY
jgi:hypothetical protein